MKALNQILESLVIGSGGMIFLALFMVFVIDINPDLAESNALGAYFLFEGKFWVAVPLIALTVIVGIISDLFNSVIFRPWESYMRRNTIVPSNSDESRSTKHYFSVRNFIFSSDQTTSIAQVYQSNRVKIRICRSWAMNTLFIFGVLAFYESQRIEFNPYLFPAMLLCGLIMIGSLVGWHIATVQELKWMEPFNQ